MISTGPVTAEWSAAADRPVATCRYVKGAMGIAKSSSEDYRYLRDLECAGLIAGFLESQGVTIS